MDTDVQELVSVLEEAEAMIIFLISCLSPDGQLYDGTQLQRRIKEALAPFKDTATRCPFGIIRNYSV